MGIPTHIDPVNAIAHKQSDDRHVAYADFERGPAEIKMTLIKHGDGRQIYGLHINSRVFFEKLSKIICPFDKRHSQS